MAYATAFELDQQHRVTQDEIAIDLRVTGESDGFNGVRPQHVEREYLIGYRDGIERFSTHIQGVALLLQQEGQDLESACEEF